MRRGNRIQNDTCFRKVSSMIKGKEMRSSGRFVHFLHEDGGHQSCILAIFLFGQYNQDRR